MMLLRVDIIIELYVLNGSFMELKPVEFYLLLKVVDEPDLNHAVLVACRQKLPSVHVNCWTNSPRGDFLVFWQLNALLFTWQ